MLQANLSADGQHSRLTRCIGAFALDEHGNWRQFRKGLNTPPPLVCVYTNVLTASECDNYLAQAALVQRLRTRGIFDAEIPRREVSYILDADNIFGADVLEQSKHTTSPVAAPRHVARAICGTTTGIAQMWADQEDNNLCNYDVACDAYAATDILLSNEHKRGGKCGARSEDEDAAWTRLLVLGLGQTRQMRVCSKTTGKYLDIVLCHNTVVEFNDWEDERLFTFQIDSLPEKQDAATIYPHYSLQVRLKQQPTVPK